MQRGDQRGSTASETAHQPEVDGQRDPHQKQGTSMKTEQCLDSAKWLDAGGKGGRAEARVTDVGS